MTQIDRLLGIMKRLRDPENGCPWDKEQTFATIAPYTLEETYEVLDAIQRKILTTCAVSWAICCSRWCSMRKWRRKRNALTLTISALPSATSWSVAIPIFSLMLPQETAAKSWRAGSRSKARSERKKAQHSALDDIPHSLPALMRAHKIQRRCSAVGFDWTSLGPVLDKVHEEIDEVMHEAQQAVVDEAKLEEEVGDLLFATVNLSRHLGVKAEVALQKANLKFERRFREVERIVAARGLEMTGIDLDTMEEVWQEVKRQETDL